MYHVFVELLNFFVLVFIDATYNIGNRRSNVLNVVIVDNHYRSVLAVTAIVRCEVTKSYSAFWDSFEREKNSDGRLSV